MDTAIDDVILTVTKVAEGTLPAHEAMGLLPALAREAVPAALALHKAHPEEADGYHKIVLGLGRELRQQERTSKDAKDLHAVIEDLSRVLQALG